MFIYLFSLLREERERERRERGGVGGWRCNIVEPS